MKRYAIVSRLGVLLALMAIAAWPAPAEAQSVRASGITRFQYVGIRPLEEDSVPVESTLGTGLLRRSVEGHVVRCVQGDPFCRFRSSAEAVSLTPLTQDLTVSAWGLGRGVRAYGHLRGRTIMGTAQDIWPRPDDHFDALAAFIELDRTRFRVRAGRQWSSSGLGFYNFDGAAALLRVVPGLEIEAYGGRSLLRGVGETRTGSALAAVDPFAPDEDGLLVGAKASWRPYYALAVGFEYQRDVRDDRRGLFSERVAADALWRSGRFEVTGSFEGDLIKRMMNDVRFDFRGRFGPEFGAAAVLRRYRPFFEAWTIWGAFDPVGFNELGTRGWWRPASFPVSVEAGVSYRSYEETSTSTTFGVVRSTGWRLNGSATVSPASYWTLQARAGADVGFGAAGSDASLRLEREIGSREDHLAASVLAFQRLYEFRVTEGTVWGFGVDGGVRLGPRTRASGSATWYLHGVDEAGPDADWDQVRGSLMVEWVVGAEPVSTGAGAP